MKKFLLTLTLVLSFFISSAQSYDHVVYKQEFDQVYATAIDSLQYKEALKKWGQLYEKYEYIHTEEYMLKAYCYYQLGKKNKAAHCVKEAWCHQTCDPAYFEQINKFHWLKMIKSFNRKQNRLVEEGYKVGATLISKDYDSLAYLMERLTNIDQEYRSSLSEEEKQRLGDSLRILAVNRDSLDMLEFLRIYNKYGYPGEKVSCLFSMRWLSFLLHTADYEWFYEKMYPLFEKDVRTGSMPATLFLIWIDRHSASNNQRAEYAVYQNPNHFKATPEELEEIKRKRFEMGVSKLFRIPYVLSSSN